jgi:hypothetical protein
MYIIMYLVLLGDVFFFPREFVYSICAANCFVLFYEIDELMDRRDSFVIYICGF